MTDVGPPTALSVRVREFVAEHPGLLVEDIARGVRARNADVRDVLLRDGFQSSLRGAYPSDRARVYSLPSAAQDGPGRVRKPSQCDLICRVLADGEWHTTAEIHQRCGYSRLNSRVSDLRKRGLVIVGEHIDGMPSGPDAYRYRLVAAPEEAEAPPLASVSSGVSFPAAADPVDGPEDGGSTVGDGRETSDFQLDLGAAA